MADYTTHLDAFRTFLLKIHTAATTKHIGEATKIEDVLDASSQRMFVSKPEIMGSDGDDFYWERYKIEIQETSEANFVTVMNNIFIGIRKFNKRTAISGFTYASAPTMCHMKFVRAEEAIFKKKKSRWDGVIWMDVEWSTS